jgi:hypothetical protein
MLVISAGSLILKIFKKPSTRGYKKIKEPCKVGPNKKCRQ